MHRRDPWTMACAALVTLASATAPLAAERATAPVTEPKAPAVASVSTTSWAELNPDQKAALTPLQREWDSIDGVRQKKWLEVAGRFKSMPDTERQRIQQRMAHWASLTPAKRNQVRMQFLEAKQLPAEQHQARWQEYQALSPDEKLALARQGRQPAASASVAAPVADRNSASRPPEAVAGKANQVQSPQNSRQTTGTSLQAKPGATTRPLTTPASPPAHHLPGLPKIVATEGFVDPATLLPKRGPQGAAVRSALTDGPTPKP